MCAIKPRPWTAHFQTNIDHYHVKGWPNTHRNGPNILHTTRDLNLVLFTIILMVIELMPLRHMKWCVKITHPQFTACYYRISHYSRHTYTAADKNCIISGIFSGENLKRSDVSATESRQGFHLQWNVMSIFPTSTELIQFTLKGLLFPTLNTQQTRFNVYIRC